MRKFLIVAASLFVLVVVLIGGYLLYIILKYPDAGPVPSVSVKATPERLARGAYLARHVAVCIDCHSDRDWTKFSGPMVPGTDGKGGFRFDESMGFPGTIFAKNITPAGIGSMSDGELLYAITTGVSRNRTALFPLMPYQAYDKMPDEDLYSVIAYIRSLAPIQNNVPHTSLNFPLNFIVRTIPKPHSPQQPPDTANSTAYGRYLANIAGCIECHTERVKGERIPGMEFAGGWTFELPHGSVRSANITPDDETGIGSWTKDLFIAKFKYFAQSDSTNTSVAKMGYNTIMPWTMFAGMTEHDLGAVYDYLRTVPPVRHDVTKFTPRNPAGSPSM